MAKKVNDIYYYTRRRVRKVGCKDGRPWEWRFWPFLKREKESYPKLDQKEPPGYEMELYELGEQTLSEVDISWQKEDESMLPAYCIAKTKLEQARRNLEGELKDETEAINDYEKASEKLAKFKPPSLNPNWMLIWLVVIGVAEFPLNSLIFSIFGENKIGTYLMAAGICVAIPLASHFFGSKLRQEKRQQSDNILLWASPIVVLLVICAISYLRQLFFEAQDTQELLGISLDPLTATVLFVLINFILFFIGILISYEGTHPDHVSYQHARDKYSEAKRELEEDSRDAKIVAKELEAAEIAFQVSKQKRKTRFDTYASKAEEVHSILEFHVMCYRTANMQARKDKTKPECFKTKMPEYKIPDGLVELNWNCEEYQTLPSPSMK